MKKQMQTSETQDMVQELFLLSDDRTLKLPDFVTKVMCLALGTGGALGENQIETQAQHIRAASLQTVLLFVEAMM